MLMAIFSGAFIGTCIAIAALAHVLLLDALLLAPGEPEAASPAVRDDSGQAVAGGSRAQAAAWRRAPIPMARWST